MTYRKLKEELGKLTETQLDDDVAMLDLYCDEFVSLDFLDIQDGDDVLHDKHVFLVFNAMIAFPSN